MILRPSGNIRTNNYEKNHALFLNAINKTKWTRDKIENREDEIMLFSTPFGFCIFHNNGNSFLSMRFKSIIYSVNKNPFKKSKHNGVEKSREENITRELNLNVCSFLSFICHKISQEMWVQITQKTYSFFIIINVN